LYVSHTFVNTAWVGHTHINLHIPQCKTHTNVMMLGNVIPAPAGKTG